MINNHSYHILNYGCQMNESDSERFAGQLEEMGYVYSEDIKNSDVIVINTCCVRESAEKKIYGKIGELKRLKQENPNMIICVAGCMAQKEGDKLLKKAPHVDLVLGTFNIENLKDYIKTLAESQRHLVAIETDVTKAMCSSRAVRKNKISAWLPIMYGCNNFCSYCIVPYVRGRERSRPLDEIKSEFQDLARQEYKEVTLLGQNVNSYGKDINGIPSFAALLKILDDTAAIERIRFMTSHPRDLSDDVISAIANGKHLCEHVHLPIQSGSTEILKRMNRGYTADSYLKLVEKLRSAIPNVSLTTDIIVGFPGESEEHFNETLELIKKVRFDAAYTFIYSKRSGTPAAVMPEQVEPAVKKARLQKLMDIQNTISLEINKNLEASKVEVLVEGTSKNDETILTGRTRTNKIVLWKNTGKFKPGDLANILVCKAQTWVLKGREEE